jgi:GNAT superfamily N-acetyltransferase
MPLSIRLLRPGDEGVLTLLAAEEDDFDLPGRSTQRSGITGDDAVAYLADPTVLHWIAEDDQRVVGHLLCYVQRRRVGAPRQLLLYEIGVRSGHRGRGVGRALISAMGDWMKAENVGTAWVLADNEGAEAFYARCGFTRSDVQPAQMTLRRETRRVRER